MAKSSFAALILRQANDEILGRSRSAKEAAIVWSAIPNSPQELAVNSGADELFFGGGAGCGKSYMLLGMALTEHSRSIIFRREYPQLRELVEKSRSIVGELGSYNGQDHIWRLNNNHIVEFGAVQYDHSVSKYQGRAHDFRGFDEICHFSEIQYRTLSGWTRTEDPNQRVRIIVTGNPPSDHQGQWVREYWGPWLDQNHPEPAPPGELIWYVQNKGKSIEVARGDRKPEPIDIEGELTQARSRTFIPGKVDDNPYYMATGYKAVLQSMPEPLRSQLLYGDFSVGVADDKWQVFPSAWVDAAIARWTDDRPLHHGQFAIGVDPARGGADFCSIAQRWGDRFEVFSVPGVEVPDGPTVAKLVFEVIRGEPIVNVDVVGIGSSPVDSLRQLNIKCNALSGADASKATDRSGKLGYRNKRSEWIWKFREMLDPDYGSTIALPNLPRMKAGLVAMRWHLSGWKITIDSKDGVKAAIGFSPDDAEAIIYASVTDDAEDDFCGFGV